jgi:hypothetical protein
MRSRVQRLDTPPAALLSAHVVVGKHAQRHPEPHDPKVLSNTSAAPPYTNSLNTGSYFRLFMVLFALAHPRTPSSHTCLLVSVKLENRLWKTVSGSEYR